MKEKVETLFSDTNVKKYIPFNSAFLLNDYNNDNIAKLEDKFFIKRLTCRMIYGIMIKNLPYKRRRYHQRNLR